MPRLHRVQRVQSTKRQPPRSKRARKTTQRRPTHDERAVQDGFRVLALDVSSVAVGWSLFVDGVLFGHGSFLLTGADHGERLVQFHDWLFQQLLDQHPTHVVYEAPYPGRQQHTFGVLMWYIGIVLGTHWQWFGYECPDVNRVPAREVKRLNDFPSGCTHAKNKALAVERVNQWYGLDLHYDRNKQWSDDDAADAILVNRAWHRRYHPELLEVQDV